MVSSHAVRASAITIFTIAAFVAISFWASGPTKSYRTQNYNRSRIIKRRMLGSEERADVPPLDPGIVVNAETRIRDWLNAERRNNCNGFALYNFSGEVNMATQGMFNGQLQGLFEVRYREEIFFARISLAFTSSSAFHGIGFSVLEMVPGPCASGIANSLAVTVGGKKLLVFIILKTVLESVLTSCRQDQQPRAPLEGCPHAL